MMTDEQLAAIEALLGEAAEHLANGDLLASVAAQARLGEYASLLTHEVRRLRSLPNYRRPPMPERLSDERLAEMKARVEAATPGEWFIEEDERRWALYAENIVTAVHPLTGQIVKMSAHPWKLINAPKQSKEQAEYWPKPEDAALIVHAPTDLGNLLAEVAAGRSREAVLVAALTHYANPHRWANNILGHAVIWEGPGRIPGWQVAHEALAATSPTGAEEQG